MKKLKFAFKTIDNKEINAKNYDLNIRKDLFGNEVNTIVLKNGNEIKYLDMKNIVSVLSGKTEIAITSDMSVDHIVGIIKEAFDENNVHNRAFTSEIEYAEVVVPPEPEPDPKPIEVEPEDPSEKEKEKPEEPIEIITPENPVEPDEPKPISNEFTYTPEPGTIKKVFLHLYDGTTKERFIPDSTQLQNVDGRDRYVDDDGVLRCELIPEAKELYKIGDSTFDIVVVFDVNVTRESNIRSSIIEPILNDTDAHERILDHILDDESHYYGFSSDLNDSSSNYIDIQNTESVTALLNSIANGERYGYGSRIRDENYVQLKSTGFHIMGSDKVFAEYDLNSDHLDSLIPYNDDENDMYSFNIGWLIENTSHDESIGFQGIYIIEKALQEGRAIDIGVDLNSVSWQNIRH